MIDFTNSTAFIVAVASTALAILAPALYLLHQLNHPTILTFPWPTPSDKHKQKDKDTKVVFAGSFNPPHNGHLGMVEYLASRYKEVIVVIGVNPSKTYSVTPQQRADILSTMIETLDLGDDCNARVEVVSGYIWRYAMENNAKIFFRGIRTWAKDGADERALHLTNLWGPLLLGPIKWPLPTHYLEGNPKYTSLSSTLIRDRCQKLLSMNHKIGDDPNVKNGAIMEGLDGLVPKEVQNEVVKAYG